MVPTGTGASDLHEVFQRSWVSRDSSAAEIIRAALVLCADHELNVSAFAARCTASAGASPYDVVLTGLATLKGRRHGGQTEAAAALWSSLTSAKAAKTIFYERLRRGEAIPGFGHPLYPKGDCRASFLLDLLYARENTQRTRLIRSVTETGEDVLGERANVDWALAAIGHGLALPMGAPLFLFAVSRTVGWIAHAIEQYESGTLIRPRARYVGRHPELTYQVSDRAREPGIR
jgi:citrate synthase